MFVKRYILFPALTLALCILIVEGLMYLSGQIYLSTRVNTFNFTADDGEFRILCLGESTTAYGGDNSYPSLLQKRLQNNSKETFKVVNMGVPGTTTHTIKSKLKKNLAKYNPHLVILMAGINDHKIPLQKDDLKTTLTKYSRIARLAYALIDHLYPDEVIQLETSRDKLALGHKSKNIYIDMPQEVMEENSRRLEAAAKKGERAYLNEVDKILKMDSYGTELFGHLVYMTDAYIKNNEPLRERLMYKFLKKISPDNPNINIYLEKYIGFVMNSSTLYQDKTKLAESVLKAYSKLPRGYESDVETVFQVGRAYAFINQIDKANQIAQQLLKDLKYDYHYWLFQISYNVENKLYAEAATVTNNALTFLPKDDRLKELKRRIKAAQSSKEGKSNLLDLSGLAYTEPVKNETTRFNLRAIVEQSLENGRLVAVMQYPTRSYDHLRKAFNYLSSDNIVLVENKKNFEQELRNKPYKDLFWDNFAGDFGHATPLGNSLIVDNLVNSLERKWCPRVPQLCFDQ